MEELLFPDADFLISSSPNPMLNGPGVIDLVVELNASTFATRVNDLEPGKKYYFKAYASNAEGTGFGLEKPGTTILSTDPGHKPELSQVGGRAHGLVNFTGPMKADG